MDTAFKKALARGVCIPTSDRDAMYIDQAVMQNQGLDRFEPIENSRTERYQLPPSTIQFREFEIEFKKIKKYPVRFEAQGRFVGGSVLLRHCSFSIEERILSGGFSSTKKADLAVEGPRGREVRREKIKTSRKREMAVLMPFEVVRQPGRNQYLALTVQSPYVDSIGGYWLEYNAFGSKGPLVEPARYALPGR